MKRTCILTLIVLLLNTICSKYIHAQDRDSIVIYFRFDTENIDSTYLTNKENITRISRIVNGTGIIDSITLRVWSSPEGGPGRNKELAERRAGKAMGLFLTGDTRKDSMTLDRTSVITVAENWEGLKDIVEDKYFRHDRGKVLDILNKQGISDETRKWRLQRLDKGYTWDYLRRIYMPVLRTAIWSEIHMHTFKDTQLFRCPPQKTYAQSDTHSGLKIPDTYGHKPETLQNESSTDFTIAIRSNLLLDAALVPNIAVEVPFGNGWSVTAGWEYSWWSKDKAHWYWRIYGGDVSVRKYFGRQSKDRILSGHHVGLYGQMFTYDFETGGRGSQSRLTYGGGLEYGYSLPVTGSLNIDFGIGLGYLTGEYMLYDPEDGCYVWKETRQRHWFGPSKAEISLVWILDFKTRKGGAR